MECGICTKEIGSNIVMLPVKSPDGSLMIMVCLKCAENAACYCKKHGRPHLGFMDDETTVCADCLEEEVIAWQEQGCERLSFCEMLNGLPSAEMNRLCEWAKARSKVTSDTSEICILRALVARALRSGKKTREVVSQVVLEKSANLILPGIKF